MSNEQEHHMHRGAPVVLDGDHHVIPQSDNDKTDRAHNYDNENVWTIETYGNGRIVRFLEQAGATEKPCLHDGRLFVVDAKYLIEALAEMNGLIVEFRKHRKRQYSEETKAALRERLAKARAAQKEVSSV